MSNSDRTCTVDGCANPIKCKGLCTGHYQQKRNKRPFTALRQKRAVEYDWAGLVSLDGKCAFDGCCNLVHAKNLCPGHYEQIRRGEFLRPLRAWFPVIDNQKVCTECRNSLALECFYRSKGKVTPKCKRCINILRRMSTYNVSWEFAERLLDGAECDTCGTFVKGKQLAVDHCHDSGAVRGVLCSGCNTALGMVKDDPRRLRALADYLESKLLFPAG